MQLKATKSSNGGHPAPSVRAEWLRWAPKTNKSPTHFKQSMPRTPQEKHVCPRTDLVILVSRDDVEVHASVTVRMTFSSPRRSPFCISRVEKYVSTDSILVCDSHHYLHEAFLHLCHPQEEFIGGMQ
jgi:hypothetical protein